MAGWDVEVDAGRRLLGRMRVGEEWVFDGHYPGEPILPGMCLVDAALRLAGGRLARDPGGEWRLEAISSCRFLAPVRPGDELRAELQIDEVAHGAAVQATIDGNGVKAATMRVRCVSELGARSSAGQIQPEPSGGRMTGDQRSLDRTAVERILPHRSPMLLVDGAVAARDGNASKPVLWAFRDVGPSRACFADGRGDGAPAPRLADALVAESFAQACGLARAVAAGRDEALLGQRRHPVIARVKQLRWSGDVVAGQRLEHRVELQASMKDGAVFAGQSFVDGRLVLQVGRLVVAVAAA